ncbi:hypothetical protein [Jeongeupia sp. USM3]|uniref:hypothetical protein n=1 Tax=Jeongeupia sp. USM3 TaxID=1906741 RepID=UPI00089DDFB8|nr:hypothetical protein [Jeongeupia sp. USM3]AOX98985.1 hypothetical protein BJP62_00055 [Jeongeupia sp. USM3]AOY02109.1 hypothetical protein BJP62_17675 [Jeongeupia sp. USM3]
MKPHLDLRGALQDVRPEADERRTALIAGAVNRLGEALLNRLLVEYRHVWVLTSKPLLSSTSRCGEVLLAGEPLDHAGLAAARLPRVDDVYCHVGERGLANQRDAGIHAIGPGDIVALAHAAAQAGARRFCLIEAMAPGAQMMRHVPLAAGETGRQLALLSFEHVAHVHPTVFRTPPAGQGWLARFKSAYLAQFAYMLPQSVTPLTSPRIAEACTRIMRRPATGHQAFDVRDLRDALEQG